jgi:predicted permease
MRRFILRLRNFLRLTTAEQDLTRELSAHLTLLQDEYERRGMSPEEADRAARIALGGIEQTKELHRDARSFIWLEDGRQDIAHSVRLLRRSPLFTLTAALSLAIGIGANTAIFTVANSLLFRAPDGIAEPRTLIDIGTLRGGGGLNPMPYATYLEISRRSTTLSGVFAQNMFPQVMSLASTTASAERVFGHYVTPEFFTVPGASPFAGRVFDGGDGDARNPSAVAVLNHGFWIRRFNQNPNMIGQVIRINGRPFTVVGVAARGFQGTGIMSPDVWLPLSISGNGAASVVAGGRLKPSASAAQAAAEFAAIGSTLDREQGTTRRGQQLHVLPSSRAGGNRNIVIGFAGALMIIVSLVLAVACANVAAIMLARSAARSKEIALRTALGARRGRLVRQLLTETVMLFVLGGVLGLALARAMILLVPLLPALPFPVTVPFTLDAGVIVFTASLSLLSALASGLAFAFKGSKADPATALKEDSSSSLGGSRLRSAFVVGQVALTLLLIVMAGLFVRALRYAGATDPGFDPHGVEMALLDLSMAADTNSPHLPFWRDVIQGVRQLPDVEAATLARVPPGGFEGISLGGIAAAGMPSRGEPFVPAWNIVDSGYFATLRIPLIAGRDFSDGDVAGAQPVAIVGAGIARRFWPGKNAVGENFVMTVFGPKGSSSTRDVFIIGVARDVKSSSLIDGLADSYVYLPLEQNGTSLMTTQMTILARSSQGQRISAEMGALVRKLNPNLVIARSETVEDSVALGLAPQRILATVAGSLGVVGLLLAAIGIYGVTAYTVARRSRELGIRMALGAEPREIVGMVLKQGMLLTALGSLIGLVLAAGASQVLSVFLYGLPPLHWPTFLGTSILFVVVGLTACYIPARRAIGIDPLRTLRYE